MEAAAEMVGRNVDADVRVHLELHAFGEHLFEPAVEDVLFELEVGNPVAEQPAEAIAPLEHDDVVSLPGQLLRGGEAGGPGADRRRLSCPSLSSVESARSSLRRTPARRCGVRCFLMLTASRPMASVQAASHGAGQTRPVISGKLLVECRFSAASRHRPR